MSDRAPDADATVQVITEPLGGSPLSRAIQRGTVPSHWHVGAPRTVDAWRARAAATQREFAGRAWLDALHPALAPSGAARQRLERVARAGGIVVTTGQQPGLFGGPIYTWSKAVSAIALADELERATGVPTAAVFWAATDDADLAEAQGVWIAGEGGAVELRGATEAPAGTSTASVPLGDLSAQLEALRAAAGSALDAAVLDAVHGAYGNPGTSIGAAYLELLRTLLEPLGMPVLDASHAVVRTAARPVTERALLQARELADAVEARTAEIEQSGFRPQVDDVAGLTPVFLYAADGTRRRVTQAEAAAVARDAAPDALGANVLLRPIAEASLLPTVAYVAGPAELAYFAQVTALAGALDVRRPVAVPRWSATLVEPHVQRALDRLGVTREELADPHAVEGALARAAMPAPLRDALAAMRDGNAAGMERVRSASAGLLADAALAGMQRQLDHTLARLERRAVAAVKRREAALMRDVAKLRGYFHPGGKRQERALTLMPVLARHGRDVLGAMLREARGHAAALVGVARSSPSAAAEPVP